MASVYIPFWDQWFNETKPQWAVVLHAYPASRGCTTDLSVVDCESIIKVYIS